MHQTSGRHAVISRWQGAGSGAQLKSNEWLRRDSREGCQDEQHGGKDAGGVPHCRLLIHWLWLSAGGECLCLYNVPRRPPALLALSLPLTPQALNLRTRLLLVYHRMSMSLDSPDVRFAAMQKKRGKIKLAYEFLELKTGTHTNFWCIGKLK